MSFLEHLDELRKRIVRALISLCVGVAHRRVLHRRHLRVRHAAAAADAPAGRDDDLHVPDRSVHAVHPHRAHRGAVHRGAADLLAGVVVRRAGALRQGAALRHSVRAAVEHRRPRRRGVLPLRRVSADVAVLRELLERARLVHAAHRGRVQRVHADAARHGGRLSDAGARVLPRADGSRHCALDEPPIQVRHPRDLGDRRGHHAERRHGQPDDRGVPDDRAVHPEHRHRVGLRAKKADRPTKSRRVQICRHAFRGAQRRRRHHILGFHLQDFFRPAVPQLDDAVLQVLSRRR